MTTEVIVDEPNVVVDDKTGGDQSKETLESLKAERDALAAEAAKERGIRKTLQAERDKWKKAPPPKEEPNEDYKKLWDDANNKLTAYQTKVKAADIRAAVTSKLSSSKVQDDKLDAALKLLDQEMIEWDEEAGVDSKSVTAAVQKLKSSYNWLFETKLVPTQLKPAAEGSADGKTITRAEFDRLAPESKHRLIVVDKFKVVD